MIEQLTCAQRAKPQLKERIDDLEKLFRAYQAGEEGEVEDIGTFPEYGLCFDYVPRGTFERQRRGYFRYQLSYGGPGDEFRFFTDETQTPVRVEYWFLDWFDGAKIILKGKALSLMLEIFGFFDEIGSVSSSMQKAKE